MIKPSLHPLTTPCIFFTLLFNLLLTTPGYTQTLEFPGMAEVVHTEDFNNDGFKDILIGFYDETDGKNYLHLISGSDFSLLNELNVSRTYSLGNFLDTDHSQLINNNYDNKRVEVIDLMSGSILWDLDVNMEGQEFSALPGHFNPQDSEGIYMAVVQEHPEDGYRRFYVYSRFKKEIFVSDYPKTQIDWPEKMLIIDNEGNGTDELLLNHHAYATCFGMPGGELYSRKVSNYALDIQVGELNGIQGQDFLSATEDRVFLYGNPDATLIREYHNVDYYALGTIDDPDIQDLLLVSGSDIHILDLPSCDTLFSLPYGRNAAFVNLDGVGEDEIVVYNDKDKLLFYDYGTEQPFGNIALDQSMEFTRIHVANMDTDPKPEIILSRGKEVVVLQVPFDAPPEIIPTNIQPDDVVYGNVRLEFDLISTEAVEQIEFFMDEQLLNSQNLPQEKVHLTLNSIRYPDGPREIRIIAHRSGGRKTEKLIPVKILNRPDFKAPTLRILSPDNNSEINSTSTLTEVNIDYVCYDNKGIDRLEIYVDDILNNILSQEDISGKISLKIGEGTHEIRMVAWDIPDYRMDGKSDFSEERLRLRVETIPAYKKEPGLVFKSTTNLSSGLVHLIKAGDTGKDDFSVLAASQDGTFGVLQPGYEQLNWSSQATYKNILDLIAVDDLNMDGSNEILVSSGGEAFDLNSLDWFDGSTHELMRSLDQIGRQSWLLDSINLNNDGYSDILLSVANYSWIVDGLSGQIGWKTSYCNDGNCEGENMISKTIGDLNGNGSEDFIVGTNYKEIKAIDPLIPGTIWYNNSFPNEDESVIYRLFFTDLNKDGTPDVIAGGNLPGILVAIDGKSGTSFWTETPPSDISPEVWYDSRSEYTMVDCNLDGIMDIVKAYGNELTAYEGRWGSVLWSVKLFADISFKALHAATLPDGSGYICLSCGNRIEMFNSSNGQSIEVIESILFSEIEPNLRLNPARALFEPLGADDLPDYLVGDEQGNLVYFEGELPLSPPLFNLPPGSYYDTLSIELDSPDGAEISYTTDGSDPDSFGQVYSEAIRVEQNTLIRAICTNDTDPKSNVVDLDYQIEDQLVQIADTVLSRVLSEKLSCIPDAISKSRLASIDTLIATNLEYPIANLDGLQYCRRIRYLDLSGNDIESFEILRGLSRLEYLDLSSNYLEQTPSFVPENRIKTLLLSDNSIRNIDGLVVLDSLHTLDLSRNMLPHVQALALIPGLLKLDLSHNFLEDLGPLGALEQLQHLSAGSNTSFPLHALNGLDRLEILDLDRISELDTAGWVLPESLHTLNLEKSGVYSLEFLLRGGPLQPEDTLILDSALLWNHAIELQLTQLIAEGIILKGEIPVVRRPQIIHPSSGKKIQSASILEIQWEETGDYGPGSEVSRLSCSTDGEQTWTVLVDQYSRKGSFLWHLDTLSSPQFSIIVSDAYAPDLLADTLRNISLCVDSTTLLITELESSLAFRTNLEGSDFTYTWSLDNIAHSSQYPLEVKKPETNSLMVELMVQNEQDGCLFSKDTVLQLNGSDCYVDFTLPEVPGLEEVNFTAIYGSGINGVYWETGNGAYSNQESFSTYYDDYGSYTVRLSGTGDGGCFAEKTRIIQIEEGSGDVRSLVPDFALLTSPTDLSVHALNLSLGPITSWYWQTGDGKLVFDQHLDYSYTEAGLYTLCLVVQDEARGQSRRQCRTINVGEALCHANTNFSHFTDIDDRSVHLRNESTDTLSGVQYFWDFGDGQSSTLAHPEHIFLNSGSQQVSLSLRYAEDQCISSTTKELIVPPLDIRSGFHYILYGNAGELQFNPEYQNENLIYYWDFGDGTFSTELSPQKTFDAQSGIYPVSLLVMEPGSGEASETTLQIDPGFDGCRANFDYFVDSSTGDLHLESLTLQPGTTLFWEFGDGFTSSETETNHRYEYPGLYPVTLKVHHKERSCFDSRTRIINIPGEASVHPSFSYAVDELNSTAYFHQEAIGQHQGHTWDFGDGSISQDENPSHHYTFGGYYEVCLSVWNTVMHNTRCREIRVAPHLLLDCQADFDYLVDPDAMNLELINRSSPGTDKFTWYVNGLQRSWERSPEIKFDQAGYYLLKLRAENTETTCYSESYQLINVGAEEGFIKVAFDFQLIGSSSKKSTLKEVKFNGVFLGRSGNILWDFGDGESNSTTLSPVHEFALGSYDVCLSITDDESGQTDRYCQQITIAESNTVEELVASTSMEGLRIYPNPCRDYLRFNLQQEDDSRWEMRIMDLQGRILRHETLPPSGSTGHEVNTSELRSGLYFLMLNNRDSMLVEKFIKE